MTDDHGEWSRSAADEVAALSDAGVARRAAMRAALEASVVTRRRRRHALRGAALAVVVFGLGALAWRAAQQPARAPAPPREHVARAPVSDAHLRHADLQRVHDDPGVIARFRVAAAPLPASTFIGDGELLRWLDEARRPSGLMRIEGRLMFTDDPLRDAGE